MESFDMYDYKEEWCHRENLRQENSTDGWIYIGVDTNRNDMFKVGLTTGSLATRASGSQNPFYTLLYAFKVKEGIRPKKITEIVKVVINFLSQYYRRINHQASGRLSEWFYTEASEMPRIRDIVHDFLYDNYSWEMNCYHCSERNIGVIYSWENEQLLLGTSRTPYRATDLSDPPVDSSCYMPGGCGQDCNCWD